MLDCAHFFSLVCVIWDIKRKKNWMEPSHLKYWFKNVLPTLLRDFIVFVLLMVLLVFVYIIKFRFNLFFANFSVNCDQRWCSQWAQLTTPPMGCCRIEDIIHRWYYFAKMTTPRVSIFISSSSCSRFLQNVIRKLTFFSADIQ